MRIPCRGKPCQVKPRPPRKAALYARSVEAQFHQPRHLIAPLQHSRHGAGGGALVGSPGAAWGGFAFHGISFGLLGPAAALLVGRPHGTKISQAPRAESAIIRVYACAKAAPRIIAASSTSRSNVKPWSLPRSRSMLIPSR